MLKNFFLVALRNLRKNRLYSFINISGLAIGITCTILILLWVSDEVTYDKFIPKHERLYQVWLKAKFDGRINHWRSVPLPTYEAMKDADHRIVNTVVTGWGYEHLLTVGDKGLLKDGYYVSEEFLDMFEFEMVQGDRSVVLDNPPSIVITESTATALFGDEDPMGKIIQIDDQHDLEVTGVLKDLPPNSSFEFDFLLTWEHRAQTNEWVVENQDNWGNNSFQIFLELRDPTDEEEVESVIKTMLADNGQTDLEKEFFLYPMERWRLYATFDENGNEDGGIIEYVQLFMVIATFILVIACINFMNLSTARSEKRAKEVGIRKSIGSGRKELITQFLGESILIATISFLIAVTLIFLVLPKFNELVDKQLSLDFTSPQFWLFGLGIILVTGLLAGSYPAFYLSAFNPVKTLKGTFTGKGGSLPRKVLVIFQFVVAIMLIVGSVVIYQQIEMVRSRALGYDQENLITIDYTEELQNQYDAVKSEMLRSGAVESMTRSNSSVTQVNSNNFVGWPGKPEELEVIFTTITCEYDYAQTMGIEMVHGRDFSKDFKSDTAAIIINKAGLDLMNLDDPVGTELDLWGQKRTLIGVTDNVLMESLYRDVKPMFLILDDWGGVITLRLTRNQDIQASLNTVESILKKFNPAYPFDYSFVDEQFERKFSTINLTQRIAIIFSVLAIIITCLGLFGLASFTAEQRTKEIGIRKVLGASVGSLIGLMSKEFTILVLIAFFLAAPLAWWSMDSYLERYDLRVVIHWWILPLAGLLTLAFALIIVANQARKAATVNPVKSLRSE